MKKLLPIIYILTLLLAISCIQEQEEALILRQADSLIENRPDSALILLQNIYSPKSMDIQNRAYYALLRTQAEDKLYIPHNNDSLINVAVNYYKKTSDRERRARAYFYQGCVYRDMGNSVERTEALLEALKAKGNKEDRLTSLICGYIAIDYRKQTLYERAIQMGKRAYRISLKLENTFDQICFSRDLGTAYRCIGEKENALTYYKEALGIAQETNEKRLESLLFADICEVYHKTNNNDSAYYYLTRSLEIVPKEFTTPAIRCTMGEILYTSNQLDSARSYLTPCLSEENSLFLRARSLFKLSEIEKKAGNLELALKYNDEYLALQEAIDAAFRRKETNEIAIKHAIREETRKKNIEILERSSLVLLTLLIIAAVAYFLEKRKVVSQKHPAPLPTNSLESILRAESPMLLQSIRQLKEMPSYKTIELVKNNRGVTDTILSKEERDLLEESIRISFSEILILLRDHFPKLTKGDLYFCALHLLDLPCSDIALIMCVAPVTVRSRKNRLKNKINEATHNLIFER